MHLNEELINGFYTSFQNLDYKSMQDCYADHARFRDPAFGMLNAEETKAMWEMLCGRAKDLRIEFSNVSADETTGSANWTAYYTFAATGRRVVNHIRAEFKFKEGRIVEHTDTFSFYNWARQALGLTGLLLGWTAMVKNKVRKNAAASLKKFMEKHSG